MISPFHGCFTWDEIQYSIIIYLYIYIYLYTYTTTEEAQRPPQPRRHQGHPRHPRLPRHRCTTGGEPATQRTKRLPRPRSTTAEDLAILPRRQRHLGHRRHRQLQLQQQDRPPARHHPRPHQQRQEEGSRCAISASHAPGPTASVSTLI